MRGGYLPGRAAPLRDLVLVVREDVVDAACVDLEALAEIGHGHGRALQVPAGEALAPALGRPLEKSPLLRVLPQGEVGGVPLVPLHLHAVALAQLVQACCRIAGRSPGSGHVVVDGPVMADVGVAGIHQALGQRRASRVHARWLEGTGARGGC